MDSKILIVGAIGTGLYFLSQQQQPTKPPKYSNPIISVPTAGNFPVLNPPVSVSGVENITRQSNPVYEDWKRAEWSTFLKDKYLNLDYNVAAMQVWDLWNNPNNKARDFFPNVEALIFSLVTYREPIAINDTFVITADSVPVYVLTSNWWNGVPSWGCAQWKMWYEKNVIEHGAQTASDKFINAWTYPDNLTGSMWSFAAYYSCGIDCDFINFFRTKGIDVAVTGAENACTLVNIATNLIDATEQVSEGVVNSATMTKNLMPFAIVAGAAYVAYRASQII